MIVKVIRFKREKDSEWELGLSFECNGDINNKIIDNNGNELVIKTAPDGYEYCVYDAKDDITRIDFTNILKQQ